jgi:hypothetical protein
MPDIDSFDKPFTCNECKGYVDAQNKIAVLEAQQRSQTALNKHLTRTIDELSAEIRRLQNIAKYD